MSNFKDYLVLRLSGIPSVRQAYGSEEEMVKHFESGAVTIPFTDVIRYWEDFTHTIPTKKEGNELPSRFQRGDKVLFGMQPDDINEWICPMAGKVIGVHFYEGKEKYDLRLGEEENQTRIYNVDSFFVQPYSEERHRCYSINK